jgi:hypothetical protein
MIKCDVCKTDITLEQAFKTMINTAPQPKMLRMCPRCEEIYEKDRVYKLLKRWGVLQ